MTLEFSARVIPQLCSCRGGRNLCQLVNSTPNKPCTRSLLMSARTISRQNVRTRCRWMNWWLVSGCYAVLDMYLHGRGWWMVSSAWMGGFGRPRGFGMGACWAMAFLCEIDVKIWFDIQGMSMVMDVSSKGLKAVGISAVIRSCDNIYAWMARCHFHSVVQVQLAVLSKDYKSLKYS